MKDDCGHPAFCVAATGPLTDLITETLTAAGFRDWRNTPATKTSGGTFYVCEGVGATVSVAWDGATPDDRTNLLILFTGALRAKGLTVETRSGHLYVTAP